MPELVSVVIPCYNESSVITATLERVRLFFDSRQTSYEVIVVDDGSGDTTAALATAAGATVLRHTANQGKGASVRDGVLAARGDAILVMDADGSTPIEALEQLLAVTGCDIVIGSRSASSARILRPQPWLKRRLGIWGNWLIRTVLGLPFRDTQCGFKLFYRSALPLFTMQTITGWGFDFELLFVARRWGLAVGEVGVPWTNDPRSAVTALGYLRTVGEVLRVRWNALRGCYARPRMSVE